MNSRRFWVALITSRVTPAVLVALECGRSFWGRCRRICRFQWREAGRGQLTQLTAHRNEYLPA